MVFRSYLSALTLILTILLCSSTPFAQDRGAADAKQQAAELEAKAIRLLETLAGQIGSLQSRENRARIASNIAGSLWKHNEHRARALLTLLEEDINSGLQPVEPYDDRNTHTLMVFLKLRSDTVERIVQHDAAAAYAFFKATEPQVSEKVPYAFRQWERSQAIALASLVSNESPELAVELGRKSLSREFSPEVVSILRKVARKDKERARILHRDILDKLKTVEFQRGWKETQAMSVLLHTFVPPEADEDTYRELISLVTKAAARDGCANNPSDDATRNCYWVELFWHVIEKVDPVQGAKLKRWSRNADMPDFAIEAYADLDELSRARDGDGILALAKKYPEQIDEIHRRAFMVAIANDDIEQAQKIVRELVTDPTVRKSMLQEITRVDAWHKITEEQLNDLQRGLAETSNFRARVQLLLYTAGKMMKGDRKVLLKILRLAEDAIAGAKPGRDQTEAELNVASMYCLAKSDRCFAMMESMVPRLNELVAAAVKLDGFDTDYVRENEWNMSGNGYIGNVLTVLAKNAGYFAWSDFDRAANLASQFERNEIRIMAQLKLAQGILNGPPARGMVTELYE